MTSPTADVLTPLSFLDRAVGAFAARTAVVDGDRRFTYTELADRCRRLAGALLGLGVQPAERVAVLGSNSPLVLESHYAVPLAGGALVALNSRLAVSELRAIVEHAGARVLIADEANARTAQKVGVPVTVVGDEYEDLLASAAEAAIWPDDEWGVLSVNYTSGTTGRPKGVMYHHRGAFLQAMAMAFHAQLDAASVFLWTLPMFHCNGWCFTWAVTAAGGRHVCLPRIEPARVWELIESEGVTHFNAAPTVLAMLADDQGARPGRVAHRIKVATGGAPPSPALLERLDALGIDVLHLYGLTETFGPSAVCQWWPEWDDLGADEQSRLRARQGVANIAGRRVRVVDADGADVPADGVALGEVAVSGNTVMLGYLHDPEATATAVPDAWFRTGDLAVCHANGYIELRDRAKDVIISGGENVASIEVEQAIDSHPAVLESAVVGGPDEKWGEVPVAFVRLRSGATATADELATHVRGRLAGFKVPKAFRFTDLPKTSSGKIQKFRLRQQLWAGHDRHI